ncbi:MAG: NADH-quinone oxidoreductase subunit NuoN [Propionibacteriaceae bacterium]|jgi:NADH-quinone oxidoreductase subunit N|nr:NADH-quinone oxidoreductase subunit NuoN [Propionibacteriaceae bacterium]
MVTLLEFTAPSIDYARLAPFLIVIGAACLGVLIEAFVSRQWRHEVQTGLAVLALLGAGAAIVLNWGEPYGLVDPVPASDLVAYATGSVMVDHWSQVFWLALVVFGLLALLLFSERVAYGGQTAFTSAAAAIPGSRLEAESTVARKHHSEVFPLALFSLAGMMLFVASEDLLVMFVALEILSFPLYVLAALARHRRLASQEAALKYFLLGAAASGIFLFGMALVFAYAGTFDLETLSLTVTGGGESQALLLAGLGLMAVGLLFKVGAVPFHSWVPDVYQGSPTPVTAFMAVCVKLTAVAGMLRLFYAGFGGALWTWRPLFIVVAILTMVIGAVVAIVQTDVKRLLAYSSVTHAGFILVGVTGALVFRGTDPTTGMLDLFGFGSVGSIMFYLVAYGLATLGCFAAVTLVQTSGREATSLDAWSGLGRAYPWFGAVMVICLLSLAGIPLTAGFVGKFAVFTAAWRGGLWWLVLIAVVLSIVAVYIYFRVIVAMFFRPRVDDVEVKRPGPATVVVMLVAVVGTLALGLVPGPLVDVLSQLSTFLTEL